MTAVVEPLRDLGYLLSHWLFDVPSNDSDTQWSLPLAKWTTRLSSRSNLGWPTHLPSVDRLLFSGAFIIDLCMVLRLWIIFRVCFTVCRWCPSPRDCCMIIFVDGWLSGRSQPPRCHATPAESKNSPVTDNDTALLLSHISFLIFDMLSLVSVQLWCH